MHAKCGLVWVPHVVAYRYVFSFLNFHFMFYIFIFLTLLFDVTDAERAEYRPACQYVAIVSSAAITRTMISTCFCRKLVVPVIVVIRL